MKKHIFRDSTEYAHCLNSNKSSSGGCPATHQRYRSVTVAIIDLLMFDVFSVVLVAYILVPPAARSFWARILSRMFAAFFKCSRRKRQSMRQENIPEEEQQISSDGKESESMSDLSFED